MTRARASGASWSSSDTSSPPEPRLVIFDLDGTLTTSASGDEFPRTPDDRVLLPGRIERVRALLTRGARVAIATNQGGIAFGYADPYSTIHAVRLLACQLGIDSRAAFLCPFHPKGTIPDFARDSAHRKPGPGMLLDAMAYYGIPPSDTLMVGDRDEDQGAAAAAGCSFCPTSTYFGDADATPPAQSRTPDPHTRSTPRQAP